VAADEVRALAGRSSQAARQIRTLIQETRDKLAGSDTMVSRFHASIKEIRASILAISQGMQDSSAGQAGGVESVNKAISQIDAMTQQDASTVEQLAAKAEDLSRVANNSARTVERFTVGQAQ